MIRCCGGLLVAAAALAAGAGRTLAGALGVHVAGRVVGIGHAGWLRGHGLAFYVGGAAARQLPFPTGASRVTRGPGFGALCGGCRRILNLLFALRGGSLCALRRSGFGFARLLLGGWRRVR